MHKYVKTIAIYAIVLSIFLIAGVLGNRSITVISQNLPIERGNCIIIDAGHGGVDGGATSCTGVLESELNLQIALRLEDLMHLLGLQTYMIRRTDCSVYTEGETIAAKKISDLKKRVQIVNDTDNAVLISIHQNHFSDSRYSGAQVFYADTQSSKELAGMIQSDIAVCLDKNNKRQIKKADGVYLMQKVQCPAVLIECGFLSNHQEEARLRDPVFQKRLCSIISVSVSKFLDRENVR